MQREPSETQPNTGDTAEPFTNFHRFTECEMVPFQRKVPGSPCTGRRGQMESSQRGDVKVELLEFQL